MYIKIILWVNHHLSSTQSDQIHRVPPPHAETVARNPLYDPPMHEGWALETPAMPTNQRQKMWRSSEILAILNK